MTGLASVPVLPHGSPLGYERGCRARGGCANHGSPDLLTCVEAWAARNGDFSLAGHPSYIPIRRDTRTPVHTEPELVHGTLWGYRRGCRSKAVCPENFRGATTCTDARRNYFSSYRAARLAGEGVPLKHGTAGGYYLGCRVDTSCPGDQNGRTCTAARAEYRRTRARRDGQDPVGNVPCKTAAQLVQSFISEGTSIREIARRTGCGRTTIGRLAAMKEPFSEAISIATHLQVTTALESIIEF